MSAGLPTVSACLPNSQHSLNPRPLVATAATGYTLLKSYSGGFQQLAYDIQLYAKCLLLNDDASKADFWMIEDLMDAAFFKSASTQDMAKAIRDASTETGVELLLSQIERIKKVLVTFVEYQVAQYRERAEGLCDREVDNTNVFTNLNKAIHSYYTKALIRLCQPLVVAEALVPYGFPNGVGELIGSYSIGLPQELFILNMKREFRALETDIGEELLPQGAKEKSNTSTRLSKAISLCVRTYAFEAVSNTFRAFVSSLSKDPLHIESIATNALQEVPMLRRELVTVIQTLDCSKFPLTPIGVDAAQFEAYGLNMLEKFGPGPFYGAIIPIRLRCRPLDRVPYQPAAASATTAAVPEPTAAAATAANCALPESYPEAFELLAYDIQLYAQCLFTNERGRLEDFQAVFDLMKASFFKSTSTQDIATAISAAVVETGAPLITQIERIKESLLVVAKCLVAQHRERTYAFIAPQNYRANPLQKITDTVYSYYTTALTHLYRPRLRKAVGELGGSYSYTAIKHEPFIREMKAKFAILETAIRNDLIREANTSTKEIRERLSKAISLCVRSYAFEAIINGFADLANPSPSEHNLEYDVYLQNIPAKALKEVPFLYLELVTVIQTLARSNFPLNPIGIAAAQFAAYGSQMFFRLHPAPSAIRAPSTIILPLRMQCRTLDNQPFKRQPCVVS